MRLGCIWIFPLIVSAVTKQKQRSQVHPLPSDDTSYYCDQSDENQGVPYDLDPLYKRDPRDRERYYLEKSSIQSNPNKEYRVGDLVGSGHFGRVHKAVRIKDGRVFAIKSVPMDHRPDMLVRELRALRIVTQAPHPRPSTLPVLLSVYRDITDKAIGMRHSDDWHRRRLWMVLEWVSGHTVPARLKKSGTMEPGAIKCVMRQVMETLCYLHETLSLVHGDLIPQNIMLEENSLRVKLVDFGLSRMVGESPTRNVAWELSKAGALPYRMRFGDMPTRQRGSRQAGVRMTLGELLSSTELTRPIPKDMLSFMQTCLKPGASACNLTQHAYFKDVKGEEKCSAFREYRRELVSSTADLAK